MRTTLSNKIRGETKDLVGVVLFNTKETKTRFRGQHFYVLQELKEASGERMRELEDMARAEYDFDARFGGRGFHCELADALVGCRALFASVTQKKGDQRVLLLTNNDDPQSVDGVVAGDARGKENALQRALDLKKEDIHLEIIPLRAEGAPAFNWSVFYAQVLAQQHEEHGGGAEQAAEAYIAQQERVCRGLMLLNERILAKVHAQRSLYTLALRLCDGVEVGVRVYKLVHDTKKPSHVYLDPKTHKELITSTVYLSDVDARPAFVKDFPQYFDNGGERVWFTSTEVNRMKNLNGEFKPGLLLCGFKPLHRIKPHHHIKLSLFAYPDEQVITGSTRAFTALLDSCERLKVAAICRLVGRINTSPRFVALLPQRDPRAATADIRTDSGGNGGGGGGAAAAVAYPDFTPPACPIPGPGFHIVHLPYAEEIRKPPFERNVLTKSAAEEEEEEGGEKDAKLLQVEVRAMGKVVKKLSDHYVAGTYDNPELSKFYGYLEGIAMNHTEAAEFEDNTVLPVPKVEAKFDDVRKYTDPLGSLLFPETEEEEEAEEKPKKKKRAPAKRKANTTAAATTSSSSSTATATAQGGGVKRSKTKKK